jgi:hypothetical protein
MYMLWRLKPTNSLCKVVRSNMIRVYACFNLCEQTLINPINGF